MKKSIALICCCLGVSACTSGEFIAGSKVIEPIIPAGSNIVADMGSRSASEIARFDIVLFAPSIAEGRVLIARVLALPGEHIKLRENGVWIDSRRIELPSGVAYSSRDYSESDAPITELHLGNDEFFVVADDYLRAYDSRSRGGVTINQIRGVVTRIDPPTNRAR